ncbi:hypothetical protein HZ326_27241 [Fusarium oxysporum f. sp. albedinis]|nr:hypothetical protein HZ326_27241 [Fusarium oxysporum f. sp. albedinis]
MFRIEGLPAVKAGCSDRQPGSPDFPSVVGTGIVYRADFGYPLRELEVNVASPCPHESDCSGVGQASYKILRHVSGKFEDFLSGHISSDFADSLPRPGIRQKLYEIPRLYPRASPMWNEGVQILMKYTAQSIMQCC